MSKQQYLLMAALLAAWNRQDGDDIDVKDRGLMVVNLIARAGELPDAPTRSANDVAIAAAQLVLWSIYIWNCAKYRANSLVSAQNPAKKSQTHEPAFLPHPSAEVRAVQRLHETSAFFWMPIGPCQLNTTLTVSALHPYAPRFSLANLA